MSSTSVMEDNEFVEQLVAFMADIFERNFINDTEVRKTVVRNMIREETFFEYGTTFADVVDVVNGEKPGGRDMLFDMKKMKVSCSAGLNPGQKTALQLVNDDVEIVYHDSTRMPHGLSFAQRIVDTQRLIAMTPSGCDRVVDVGGNYTLYLRKHSLVNTHCCNYREGELEEHRQVQREVMMDYEAISIPDGVRCGLGAQNCVFKAQYGYSLHTLPNIDPDFLVDIFANHDLEMFVSIFHYDVALEVSERGYIGDAQMHWQCDDSGMVEFHFDNDSSHPYHHRRDWLLQYGRTFVKTRHDVDFVIWSQVDFIAGGRAQVSMFKLRKNTLGVQDAFHQHRYTGVHDVVRLMVPKFSETSGFPVTDPRGYILEPVEIPGHMFKFIYRHGLSNDTSRHDKPLSLEDIRNAVHTFNVVRQANNTNLTVAVKIPTEMVNDVVLGMYLAIAYDAAQERLLYSKYTVQMKALQDRWGAASLVWMMTRVVTSYAILPFLALADGFDDMVAVMAAQMKLSLASDVVRATYHYVSPCRPLPALSIEGYTAGEQLVLSAGIKDTREAFDMASSTDVQGFYHMCKDLLPNDTRLTLERYLDEEGLSAEKEMDEILEDTKDMVPTHMENVTNDRESWYQATNVFESALADDVKQPLMHVTPQVGDEFQVMEYAIERIYEYGLYKVDEGIHAIESARGLCRRTFTAGQPNLERVREVNQFEDADVRFYSVVDGVIQNMPDEERYACVINPMVEELTSYMVNKTSKGQVYISDSSVHTVFTCAELKIHNGFQLGNAAIKMARGIKTVRYIPIILVDAIAGAGKTYTIEHSFTPQDVIVCSVRNTADSTADSLKRMTKDDGQLKFPAMDKVIDRRVRSADSAFLASNMPRAKTLYYDEGLMSHSGQMMALAQHVRAEEIRVYGDPTQIGVIQRGSKLAAFRFESLFFWTQVMEMNETVRLPADALIVHSMFHNEERRPKLRTYSPVMRSIQFEHDTNLMGADYTVPKDNVQCVCILTTDLGTMSSRPGFYWGKKKPGPNDISSVLSVHESQGGTFPYVQAIRLNPKTAGVLSSKAHLNVMYTRHTCKYKYTSTIGPEGDAAAKIAVDAMNYTDEQLRAVMLPTPDWLKERIIAQHKKLNLYSDF